MNNSKRVPIGRKLGGSKRANLITFKSGETEEMIFTVVDASDVEQNTYLSTEIQPRIYSELDKKKIAKLAKSMKRHQFVPCFGFKDAKGRICIFDGSRRRAAATQADLPLNIWVISKPVSIEDAKWIAREMQTNTESLNRRENGTVFFEQQSGNEVANIPAMTLREIAEDSGFSLGYVHNAIMTAKVNSELILLITEDTDCVESDLTVPNYKALLEIQQATKQKQVEITEVGQQYQEKLNQLDTAAKRISFLSKQLMEKKATTKVNSFVSLIDIDKNKWVRKIEKNPRKVVFEFSRMDSELISEVEAFIKQKQMEKEKG